MDDYPEANARHYTFMLQGLQEVESDLHKRDIKFVIRHGSPAEVALKLGKDAALIVADRGYLRHQRQWRELVGRQAACAVVQVESDVVVPVECASDKNEWAARTLRPKITKLRPDYLQPLEQRHLQKSSLRLALDSDFDLRDVAALVKALKLDHSVAPVRRFAGGYSAAQRQLADFLRNRFDDYHNARNPPAANGSSMLSPYLHFGQISALEMALQASQAKSAGKDDRAAFLEELIVRRELAMNFVFYNKDYYDSYHCLPHWARETLAGHRDDERPHRYSRKQLEEAQTHDPYWNASMREMQATGYMANYMRMYWGKKILEWSNTPDYAYRSALYLNNKYFLDGRDANSYGNIAWCFGLHDRPWKERPVFGKIRYMNAAGLERKFDMDAYLKKVKELTGAEK
jgi:deoxyribodipyrimidine photo-lyase